MKTQPLLMLTATLLLVLTNMGCVAYQVHPSQQRAGTVVYPHSPTVSIPVFAGYSRTTTVVRNVGPVGGMYVPVQTYQRPQTRCPACGMVFPAGSSHRCRYRQRNYGDLNHRPHVDARYSVPRAPPPPAYYRHHP